MSSITRRRFLASTAGVAAVAALPRGFASALSVKRLRPDALLGAASSTARPVLVLCTLYGGNDGLNTVVPLDDSAYLAQRGNIAIAANDLLPLVDGFGLNPALSGLKSLWDQNAVAIIRGVGYPSPSLSHFQSMDIWQSGSTKNDVVSGWLGRWLDRTKDDPFTALSVGPIVIPAMVGESRKASAVQDSTYSGSQVPNGDPQILNLYHQLQRPLPSEPVLARAVSQSGVDMLNVSHIVAKALGKEAPPTYRPGVNAGDIGTQFGIVSQLIRAGVPTTAYSISQGNYDTHAGEVATQTGNLTQLDEALTAFFASLKGSPHATNTVVVIYSEFGRRVESNASGGTDHGAANDVFVIGASVKGGFYGDPPDLTHLDENGNLVHSVDYRSVYATVLERVLGFESKPVLAGSFPTLGFL